MLLSSLSQVCCGRRPPHGELSISIDSFSTYPIQLCSPKALTCLSAELLEENTNSAPLFLKKAVSSMNQTIAKLWKTIDIKNASLFTCFTTKLNLILIKGAKVCPLFPVEAFAFSNEIPTFLNFLRTIESQTNLKGSIRVEARAKHYAILVHKEEDILMIQFIIKEKRNLITNQLESSYIWRINHDAYL